MQTPHDPSPPGRSSVTRKPTPAAAPDAAAGGPIQLPGQPTDDTPTIISSNRPRTADHGPLGDGLQGRRLGHFELIGALGVGGMAAVLRARDLDLGREVALKILPPEMAADPENITRFKQEARAAAKLDHENIARAYFCGEDQGLHFIAFEYVEGENLRTLLDRRGPLPVAECVHYMVQVAQGLGHAAGRGVIHRDIKPSNIIITPGGKAKIVDMGLARNLDARHASGLTQSGVTLGTFDYISPEQALEPRQADARSDIYSLGCTFYHVLTGHAPVPEGTAAKKLHCHQHVPPLDPRQLNPAIPDDLAAVLARMMAKDPAQRYQSPEQLVRHLSVLAHRLGLGPVPSASSENGMPVPPPLPGPPRLSMMAAGLLTLALVAVIAVFTAGGPRAPADGRGPAALWPADPPGSGAPAPADASAPPVRPGAAAPRVQPAANLGALKAALQKGAAHVRLTGADYDLSGEDAGLSFQGHDLELEGADFRNPPVVRLSYAPAADARSPRPGAMTLRGQPTPTGSPARLRLKSLHLKIDAPPGETDPNTLLAAIAVTGFGHVEFESCIVETARATPGGETAAVLVAAPADGEAPDVRFAQCYFAEGDLGVVFAGRVNASAFSCAFAPHLAVFQAGGPGLAVADVRLKLEQCSALLRDGAVARAEAGSECAAEAGHCLFSCPGAGAGSELVRAEAGGTATLRAVKVNGYHHVPPAEGDDKALVFGATPGDKSPWREADPLARLRRAKTTDPAPFQVNLDDPRVHLDGKPGATGPKLAGMVLGVVAFPTDLTAGYPLTLSSPRAADPKRKLVRPTGERGPGVYRTLAAAIGDAEPDDVIEIQHDGLLPIDPVALDKAGLKLTIRPAAGSRPVLALKPTELKDASLFRVVNGSLRLEDLQFLLRPERSDLPDRGRLSAAAIAGGGRCELVRCAATMEETEQVQAALVSLADPANAMMRTGSAADKPPVPHVELIDCFVRGRGDLLAVLPSRPFEFDAENVLAVLDGSLIDVEAARDPPALAPGATVRLRRLTTYLTGPLLSMHSPADRVGGPPNLAGTQVTAEGCLFVSASGRPAVKAEGLDADQLKVYLSWGGRDNLLAGFTGQLIEVQPPGMSEMPLKMFKEAEWQAFTNESCRLVASAKLRFAFTVPAPGQSMTAVRPTDFQVAQWPDPRPATASDPEVGARVRDLPRPSIE
jgi:hypothetical protein